MGTPVLWHIEISHFNEKARWALDLKGVPHERRAVTPGLQELRALRVARARTTPILELDGRAIADSTRVIEAIEARWPEPPLYPADTAERLRALEIEDYFDEDVGHDLRRVVFAGLMERPECFVQALYGDDHPRLGLIRRLEPVLTPLVKARFKVNPEATAASRAKVEAAFDLIEAEAGPDGYLVGDSFSVADLTAAALLSPLVVPPEFPYIKLHPDDRPPAARALRDSFKDRPGFRWVLEMYRRHRPVSAAVPA